MPDQAALAAPDDPHAALRARWTEALEAARTAPADGTAPDPTPYADNLLARWARNPSAATTHSTTSPRSWTTSTYWRPRTGEHAADLAARPPRRLVPRRGVRSPTAPRTRSAPPASPNARSPRPASPRTGTAEVARLVRLTVTHDPGARRHRRRRSCATRTSRSWPRPRTTYAAYTAAVREEYAFVPEDAFRAGRAAVLRQLLALPRLFWTPYGTERWEKAARDNIAAELERL